MHQNTTKADSHTDHVGVRDIDWRVDVDSLPTNDLEGGLLDKITLGEIRSAIHALDDGHRLVARMALLADMPIEKVARLGHLSTELAQSILDEAIVLLRAKFNLAQLN